MKLFNWLFKKFKLDIVIAHYKENLEWINEIENNCIENIFIYTKGNKELYYKNKKIKQYKIPNIGRESQTYLYHCIKNYDDIKSVDFIFFLQGSPHGIKNEQIENWINLAINKKIKFTDNFTISSPYQFLKKGRCKYWAGKKLDACDCDIKNWAERFVRPNLDLSKFPIFWNACFGVSTEKIANVDIKRYEDIIKELNSPNPECGHYCERLWYYIFDMDF